MSIKIQVLSDLHLEFLKTIPKIFKPKFSQKPRFVKALNLFLAGDIGHPKLDSGLWLEFITPFSLKNGTILCSNLLCCRKSRGI